MPKYIMKNQGVAGELTVGDSTEYVEQYLRQYNPEEFEGRGQAIWTQDPDKAMVFDSLEELLATWNAVPESRPLRADGKPNKPLTAVNIEIVRLK